MTRHLTPILALLAALGLAACNTIQGAGQDIENAGEGLSAASEDVEEEL